jgi:hypothetical protein
VKFASRKGIMVAVAIMEWQGKRGKREKREKDGKKNQ